MFFWSFKDLYCSWSPFTFTVCKKQHEHSAKYLPLCSIEEKKPYRFGMTWGSINYDKFQSYVWTIPLNPSCRVSLTIHEENVEEKKTAQTVQSWAPLKTISEQYMHIENFLGTSPSPSHRYINIIITGSLAELTVHSSSFRTLVVEQSSMRVLKCKDLHGYIFCQMQW